MCIRRITISFIDGIKIFKEKVINLIVLVRLLLSQPGHSRLLQSILLMTSLVRRLGERESLNNKLSTCTVAGLLEYLTTPSREVTLLI